MLVRFAPSSTLINRMRSTIADVFNTYGLDQGFIKRELHEMRSFVLAKTTNRSVLGTMNDFAFLARVHQADAPCKDLVALSERLAETPCGPRSDRHITPANELKTVAGIA